MQSHGPFLGGFRHDGLYINDERCIYNGPNNEIHREPFYETDDDDEKSFTIKCDKVFIGKDYKKRINLIDELNNLKKEIELIKDAMGFIPGKIKKKMYIEV